MMMDMENALDIFKALSNETRLDILRQLKNPEENYGELGVHIPDGDEFDNAVCVGSICEKAGISQSTISHYLDMLQRAGLLESRRFGKWTYYRRNEQAIQELSRYIAEEL